jgi:hydrogenase maturation protease
MAVAGSGSAAVLCVGNPLVGDDGLGPAVAAALDDERVLDCGTIGYAMLSEFKVYTQLLIVDAVKGSGQVPGTILRYQAQDIKTYDGFKGAHDVRLSDVVNAADLLGYHPCVECLGVEVADLSQSMTLSPPVQAALPQLCAIIKAWLNAHS